MRFFNSYIEGLLSLFQTRKPEKFGILPDRSKIDKVWKNCRASKETGRELFCPKCHEINIVYHFSWASLKCGFCETCVEKYQWWTRKNQLK